MDDLTPALMLSFLPSILPSLPSVFFQFSLEACISLQSRGWGVLKCLVSELEEQVEPCSLDTDLSHPSHILSSLWKVDCAFPLGC